MTELRDDPRFHLEAGIDVASRTWSSWEVLSAGELRALGRAQIQDADYGDSARASLESIHPELSEGRIRIPEIRPVVTALQSVSGPSTV